MSFCKNCGATLGVGRFCTNCGAAAVPDAGRGHEESAAERTNVRMPVVQPDAATGTRYPLFVDEDATAPRPVAHPIPRPTPPPGTPAWMTPGPHHAQAPAPAGGFHSAPPRRRRSPAVWAVPLVLLLVCLTGLGIWLGTRGDDSTEAVMPDGSTSPSEPTDDASSDTTSESPSPTVPTDDGEPPVDLSKQVKASGPKPIAPGVDLANNPVTYPIGNVLDGDPSTAYRLPGDARGEEIALALPSGTTVLEVGLINGYAKTDTSGGRTVDWYTRNRRVLEVEWSFDDGTKVRQQLTQTKEMQVLAVNNIATDKVVVRILKVSGKPTGNLAKDVTAISEIVVRGRRG